MPLRVRIYLVLMHAKNELGIPSSRQKKALRLIVEAIKPARTAARCVQAAVRVVGSVVVVRAFVRLRHTSPEPPHPSPGPPGTPG